MNPDKLFDYLDGKLSPADREELENKLIDDAQLQRQFAIARDIHRSGRTSREVAVPVDDPAAVARAGRLGRRIATACIALVVLNVGVGLAVITVKSKKPKPSGNETAIRQQLAASLDAVAQTALPAPSFAAADIQLNAPKAEWDALAAKIMAAAESCAGSAAKGLPDDNLLIVVADIPSSREAEFRQLLVPTASPAPVPAAGRDAPNERTIVQVRIAEAAR